MARLNTHLSATPQPSRASTVDSLYRDPSAAPRIHGTARNSSYSVISPSASINSDKENELPSSRQITPRPTKRGHPLGASARMPTPDTGSTVDGHSSKRRRTGNFDLEPSQVTQDELEDETGFGKFYNPNQDPEQRRRLRATIRDHSRMMDENRDVMIQQNNLLLDALKKQDNYFGKVRQTADAALDSRFLVNASDLAGKKLNNSLQGNAGVGIDLDQFVSKCIYFMKSGGSTASQADVSAALAADDDDEEGDGLDWAFLGRQACFPCNRRPPTSSFLLGPLSVQKRIRATQRKARSQRQPVGPATRPQEIKEGDIQQSENSNLSTLVKSINTQLREHIQQVGEKVMEELSMIPDDEVEAETVEAALRRSRVTTTVDQELAVSLLDFAINPHDFGQTVENLFYISFLVREGNAKIIQDDDGLPLLMPADAHAIAEQRENNVQKNQAVLSIDYATWKMFIDAFDIKEPLIPNREMQEANIAPGGWYS
ncbi:Nse4 C-terminal-domain-containing protein [Phaeosphaeriaceae sp. PMI808]|nr:Nse4 C-terminal-domain-containing protein [Phaeosphaeriaceae sp. PMI808]